MLGQLSSEPELSRKIAMRGAVPLLSNMLTHQVAMTRRTAAFCLGRLVADPDVKGAVVTLGALPRLINMLDGDNNLHAPAFVLSQLPASPDLALAVSRVGVLERMWELRQEGGASRDAGSCIARCIASTGAQLSSPVRQYAAGPRPTSALADGIQRHSRFQPPLCRTASRWRCASWPRKWGSSGKPRRRWRPPPTRARLRCPRWPRRRGARSGGWRARSSSSRRGRACAGSWRRGRAWRGR